MNAVSYYRRKSDQAVFAIFTKDDKPQYAVGPVVAWASIDPRTLADKSVDARHWDMAGFDPVGIVYDMGSDPIRTLAAAARASGHFDTRRPLAGFPRQPLPR